MFVLPPLPYAFDALAPAIDEQGVRRHYLDNHAGYTKKVNELAPKGASLPSILATAPIGSPLYNNAAQYWAHNMWWEGMRPASQGGGRRPTGASAQVVEQLGGYEAFKKAWVEKGGALFGSGWVWLTLDRKGRANIVALPNAILPQRSDGSFPILVSDLWEHAYYCQYGTKRKDYLARFLDVVCWNSVNARIALWQRCCA
ncbi:MAG: superoxide dismutase [Proteobacteria bacterium]|nr:superoxide dismutase [Pseudomonadota bacterium]